MDQSRFQEAQQAYDAGDYRTAAKGFLASASRGPEGNGAAYHMAGNALMRLRRHQDAVTVYGHALRDAIYDRRGAVWANLGKAYCEIGEYAEAAKSYESALDEPDYKTPYKAYQGMAGALLERGRVEDAAVAYRKAALDPGNPNPGKALVNLGLCFMGLGRPKDAVEAYRAALGFDDYKGRGRALANLGQAYLACNEFEEAARSFEKATQLHNHQLSPAAAAAYATALAHTQRPGIAEAVDDVPAFAPTAAAIDLGASGPLHNAPTSVDSIFDAEVELGVPIDNAVPAESPVATPVSIGSASGDDALDLSKFPSALWDEAPASAARAETGELVPADATQPLAPFDHPNPQTELGFGDEEAVADFFSATDEELRARDREARRAERHERGPLAIWRTVAVAVVAIAIVVGALVAAYELGYGWPTQAQTVGGLLSAFETGSPFDSYWVAAPSKDIVKEMAKIPPVKSFTIDNVSQGAATSTVAVTVTPKTGAALHYSITLSREGVGWKVSGVDNDWRSTGG